MKDTIAIIGTNYGSKYNVPHRGRMLIHLEGKDGVLIPVTTFDRIMDQAHGRIDGLRVHWYTNALWFNITADKLAELLDCWGFDYEDRRRYI